ncbi:hypothetical protein [Sphingobacterium sp. UDSM-2020]|uniref:hypothetical protein n=1 Tax=Sphingobacterium sp. UDSM-2020 TaxID=2795738 RepID=UPI0019351F34|nr:hypothetical protein [Sphingobacterium sp. UDSM-2020]QQD11624.1 hypothetical protein JAZ75_13385 [Sphingobacterium sp. UDSM-2020]
MKFIHGQTSGSFLNLTVGGLINADMVGNLNLLETGSIPLAGRDMQVNGFTTSNILDATMSGLAVSGYGTGVAAGYFLLNSGSILYDGKDIGQRYDELVNKYR